MPEYAYVYILANGYKRLYIGITTNLQKRLSEHKQKCHPDSHTARYHIDQLVYYERFTSIPPRSSERNNSKAGYASASSN